MPTEDKKQKWEGLLQKKRPLRRSPRLLTVQVVDYANMQKEPRKGSRVRRQAALKARLEQNENDAKRVNNMLVVIRDNSEVIEQEAMQEAEKALEKEIEDIAEENLALRVEIAEGNNDIIEEKALLEKRVPVKIRLIPQADVPLGRVYLVEDRPQYEYAYTGGGNVARIRGGRSFIC